MAIVTLLLMPLATRSVRAVESPVVVEADALPVRPAVPPTLPLVPIAISLLLMPRAFCRALAEESPVTESAVAATVPVADAATLPDPPTETGASLRPTIMDDPPA